MLIDGCVRNGALDRAWETFDALRQRGLEPDAVTFSVLMRACGMRYESERAIGLLEEMEQYSLQPTRVTFNALIYACRRADMFDRAAHYFSRMEVAEPSLNHQKARTPHR